MHERRFHGTPQGLRSRERLERLHIDEVVELSLEGILAESVLDIGVGSGIFAEVFAERGLRVAGVDVNPRMLKAAVAHVPDGVFHLAPSEELPFPDKAFDLVFMSHVLHETDDPVQALREAARVGAGRIAILEWPYRMERQGPPLAHRLSQEQVLRYAEEAELGPIKVFQLDAMTYFRISLLS